MNTSSKQSGSKKFIGNSVCLFFAALILCPALAFTNFKSKEIIRRSKQTITKGRLNSIAIAIKNYEMTYGLLPSHGGPKDKAISDTNVNEYYALLELLSCKDSPDKGDDITANKRNMKFLAVPKDFKKNGFNDEWGNKFVIFMDTDYDGAIKVFDKNIKASVLVYSYGKNKRDNNGEPDDVCSWK